MTNGIRLAVHVSLYLIPALAVGAETSDSLVRATAIVQKYEVAAMEDAFDDGRFVVYDAVTFTISAPADLANQTIRVYLRSGSMADDSPLRKIGQRCRFDFDKNRLRERHLFLGALENLRWMRASSATDSVAVAGKRPIDTAVLAAVEKALVGLERDARRDEGKDVPPPARQVAYYLLLGLAHQGELLEEISAAGQQEFDVELRGGRSANLMSVFADVRVALIDNTIQDKSGTFVLRTAVLYVRQDGKWVKKGIGEEIARADVSDP